MPEGSVELLWTHRADRDLGRAILFLEDQSVLVADRWTADLLSRVALLRDRPEMGAPVDIDGEPSLYRRVVVGRYSIYYRYERDQQRVLIIRLRHSARDPMSLVLE